MISASIGKPGNFENKKFKSSLKEILVKCKIQKTSWHPRCRTICELIK